MRESANFCENRLLSYLTTDNAAFTTNRRIPPMLPPRSMKTDRLSTEVVRANVKTAFDHASTLPRKASLTDQTVCRMYFIAGAGLIKIGISTNVTARFRAIRNSSPVPVELLGHCRGSTATEGLMHSRFSGLRQHGEWFKDTPELRDEIARRLK
jgi:hypothetical protein